MIDLNKEKFQIYKTNYGGINGAKFTLYVNDKYYMLKMKSKNEIDIHYGDKIVNSYNNSIYSEYITSSLINMLNFDNVKAQETQLVSQNGKVIGVACKDFLLNNDTKLKIFEIGNEGSFSFDLSLGQQNSQLMELDNLLEFISAQHYVDPKQLNKFFWNQFVLDSWFVNPDRHNHNWGFIVDITQNKYKIAPIYDNGSSLFAKFDQDAFKWNIKFPKYSKDRIVNTKSALKINSKRFKYSDFYKTYNDDNFFESITNFLIGTKDICLEKMLKSFNKDVPEFMLKNYKNILKTSYQEIFYNSLKVNPHYREYLKNHKITFKDVLNKDLLDDNFGL